LVGAFGHPNSSSARFREGLVFEAHRLFVALNSRLESNKEEDDDSFGHPNSSSAESEFCIDRLLVRIHFIIVMIRRTGLAPWESSSARRANPG